MERVHVGYSGCPPLVPVVKTADLRYANDRSTFRRLHLPPFGRVLGQREVCPGLVMGQSPDRMDARFKNIKLWVLWGLGSRRASVDVLGRGDGGIFGQSVRRLRDWRWHRTKHCWWTIECDGLAVFGNPLVMHQVELGYVIVVFDREAGYAALEGQHNAIPNSPVCISDLHKISVQTILRYWAVLPPVPHVPVTYRGHGVILKEHWMMLEICKRYAQGVDMALGWFAA
jgi:hypothetical protein